jgi:hypothetical protein
MRKPADRARPRAQFSIRPIELREAKRELASSDAFSSREPASTSLENALNRGDAHVATAFFFATFGFAVFGEATGSGPRSIDVRRPAVKV